MNEQLRVIVSGGGTGGHIFPAVAIANEIKKQHPGAEVLFVGATGRMEMEKVPAAGYRIIGVTIAGLQRRLALKNLKLPFLIAKSLLQTRRIIREFKPHVVVGTGGYVSGPVLAAASMMGIPYLLQEQNSYAGITNKLLARRARRICVAYEGMEKFFPPAKILISGNPVRQDLKDLGAKKPEALEFFKLTSDKKILLIIGGSLGARTINEAIGKSLSLLLKGGIQVIWQTGRAYAEKAKSQVPQGVTGLYVQDFISRMDLAYAAADLVISRAGASSVSELCNLGLPIILVPSPNVAEDHQTKNAMALVNRQAAVMVRDNEANQKLAGTALALINDKAAKEALSKNILQLAHHDSAEVIAAEVIRISTWKP